MLPEISRAAVLEAVAGGTWVVTATRRLSRVLQLEYARCSTQDSWPTPRIMPWAAWVQHQYRELRDFGRLAEPRRCLEDSQSQALWEELLARDDTAGQLLLSGGVAEGFRDAWRLAHEWGLSRDELQARGGEDCRVFLRVARAYQRRLDEAGAVDAAQLPGLVAPALETDTGERIAFAGFDRFTPAQQNLVAGLGARALRVAGPAGGAVPEVFACADAREELAAVVAWARRQLQARPSARIGIVVPDLEARAALLEQLLDDALAPARLWPGRDEDPRPWNISLARPLAETPLADTALRLLAFCREPAELGAVSRVLRSPFTAAADSEGPARARLEAWLREHIGEPVLPRALLAGLRGEGRAPACPALATGVDAALALLAGEPRRRPPSRWAADFSRALRALGWPGARPLGSDEWQTLQAWSESLDALAALDAVVTSLTHGQALARLRRIVVERRFQPESPEVPIQVLGVPETVGLEFDALWVTGLHDGVLPASMRPCPLLPAALQRERGLPRACPDTEHALAERLVARLAASAPTACFSFPAVEADEPLRPSPVLARLGTPTPGPAGHTGMAAGLWGAVQLEAVADETAPPVAGEVRGGSSLLADQSACPFRAFALHRLHARPLEEGRAGVDPRERGSFLHQALRLVWEAWRGSDQAGALDSGIRARVLQDAARRAAAQHLAGLPRALVDIEVDAGVRVMTELLAVDLARPAFAVQGCEAPFEIELGALRLRGRMDRVDEVDRRLVIIDYKTGSASPAAWDSERPAEPQMPLYALALDEAVTALAYASLKPGEVGYKGRQRDTEPPALAGDKIKAPIIKAEDWSDMLGEWRRVLGRLAQDFAAGRAAVAPLRPTQRNGSCAYCRLPTLCRRDELLRLGAIGDE
ncbi:MAG: PD-(D/E)XK nuclease family protein [Gammaproteobacteria bacterium]|jgi:probable DNA repair protein